MDQNKLTSKSNSIELEISDLKLPSLSDFSKVKVILTVNNYTQFLTYPFKAMTIPLADDFSVLEISIMHINSIFAGIEVPISLFKNKKSQTFKLINHTPLKKSSPNKSENNEITLTIKVWPNNSPVEVYKDQIRQLELKVKQSEDQVESGLKSQRDMQENFEGITKNLAKMIRGQEETINSLIIEKEKMNEYLKNVENELKNKKVIDEDQKYVLSFSSKREKKRFKSFDFGKGTKSEKEYILKLENELSATREENFKLKERLEEYFKKIEDLEYKMSEFSVSTSGEKVSDRAGNEGLVISLRGEMAKMAAKYKTRINKLIESRNSLIQENKNLQIRNEQLERLSAIKNPETAKSPSESKPNSYKLLGKYAENIKKIENSLNKSPRVEKREDACFQSENNSQTTRRKSSECKPSQMKDQIDVLLEEFLVVNNVPLSFVKESEGIYQFGSKRVFIKLENNKVFVRIGAGFLLIDEFLKIYLPLELEKINRDKAKESDLKSSPFARIKDDKFVTCFGVQRRSASVSKLPLRH